MLKTLKSFFLVHAPPAIRRRDQRFLLLSLLLGAGVALAFALSLYVLYRQRPFG